MLVLVRKCGQRIIIGDRLVEIEVLGIREGHVRIGINAPKEITVHREEIYQRIEEEKRMQDDPEGLRQGI